MSNLIPPHGGYQKLKSFQTAEIIFDFTKEFCDRYLSNTSYSSNKSYRTYDQMFQAARSGKQNIVEGSQDSGTSKKTELKLVGVARGSLQELLEDYKDFLRQRNLSLWGKDSPRVAEIRQLAYLSDKSYQTYGFYLSDSAVAANVAICLINQVNFLLDRQIKSLEEKFIKTGGWSENIYNKREQARKRQRNPIADNW